MNADRTLLGIRGFLIDAPQMGELRSIRDGGLIIDPEGRILEIGEYDPLRKAARPDPVRWIHSERVAVFPGLIDLHTHVPQYPAVARGTSDLLPWLREHIFPLEKNFTGPRVRTECSAFFRDVVRHGTTTVAAYTAIFRDACEAAFDAADRTGVRAIIGKVMMDVGSYGRFQPQKIPSISLHETEMLCEKWHGAANGRLEYAVSPRFAVSCTPKLMVGAAELAKKHNAYIQTHLAENLEELDKVRAQYPDAIDYTDVYDRCGLLTPKTILGHCIHLSDREYGVLSQRGCAVAHCPTANLFLSSGIMKLDRMVSQGIKVGLGTDVAAGPELNLWQVMRSMIESQKARSFCEKDVRVPTPAEALYLSTQGAASALGKGDQIGSFEIGKEADLTIMDCAALLPYRTTGRSAPQLDAEDILNLCIYRGGPESVLETFVRGASVYRAPEPELF